MPFDSPKIGRVNMLQELAAHHCLKAENTTEQTNASCWPPSQQLYLPCSEQETTLCCGFFGSGCIAKAAKWSNSGRVNYGWHIRRGRGKPYPPSHAVGGRGRQKRRSPHCMDSDVAFTVRGKWSMCVKRPKLACELKCAWCAWSCVSCRCKALSGDSLCLLLG